MSARDEYRSPMFWVAVITAILTAGGVLIALLAFMGLGASGPPSLAAATPSAASSKAPTPHVPPSVTATDPGPIRFYDPSLEPSDVYPNVLAPPDTPLDVALTGITASGSTLRAIQVTLSGTGVSRVQLTIKDPSGEVLMTTSEFVTTPPSMELVYEIESELVGFFTVDVHDVVSGLTSSANLSLEENSLPADAGGVPIGATPHFMVNSPVGSACDEDGALIPIMVDQVDDPAAILEVVAPAGVVDELGAGSKDYSGVIDNWGHGYFAVVVHAESCTGRSLPGFTARIQGKDAYVEFPVPN